jgi:hypothetical protein
MTDDNATPTTRAPIPEPPAAPTEGWPGTTTAADATAEPAGAGGAFAPSPPVASPAPEPPPPIALPPVAPPPRRAERDRGRTASVLFGLVILGLGLWFFAEITLGYQLPSIRWSQVWPAFLIVLGLWVVLGSMRRGSR